MKYNCDIVRDLLPLYQDGIASDASKLMVKEHLEECRDCTDFFQEIQKELSVNQKDKYEEKKAYISLAKRIRRTRWYWRLIIGILIGSFVWASLMYAEGYRLNPLSAAYAGNILTRERPVLDTIKIADDKMIYLFRDGADGGLYREVYVTFRFPFWRYQYMTQDYYIYEDTPLQILTGKTIANSLDKSLYMIYAIAVNDTHVASVELGREGKMQKELVKQGMVHFVWDETDDWDGTDNWPGIISRNELKGTAYAADGTPLYMLQNIDDKLRWKSVGFTD